MSWRAIFSKWKPCRASEPKNRTGVMAAVDAMWARTSRTVQPSQSDGVSHCSSVSWARSSARAARSAAIVDHIGVLSVAMEIS
ncbi:hypothetical protein MM440_00045 [Arsenicicoccus piscis]|nr:hypothetical protein [Arsenicicoccus piscis]MCH8626222.1 hypothetical protein [Arsenicicoccus piscis]